MSQASAGIRFDLVWDTSAWRAQLDAAQTDLMALASNASQMQIMIPVVMEDRLTAQVDALIAEIQATRQIVIPVVMAPGGGGGVPGIPGGGGGSGGVSGAAEFGSVEWMNAQYDRERQRIASSEFRRDLRETRPGFQEDVAGDLADLGVAGGGIYAARVNRSWDSAAFAQFKAEQRAAQAASGINRYGGVGSGAYGPGEQFTQEEIQRGIAGELSESEMAAMGTSSSIGGGIGTAASMGGGGAAAAAGGGGLAGMLPSLGLAFMAFRAVREGGRDIGNYDEAKYMMAQANNMMPGTSQDEIYLKIAEKQQTMYSGFFGGLARMGQDFLPDQGDSSAESIDQSVVLMQGNIATRRWQEQQLRQRIRDADINDTGFTNRLGKEFQFDPDFRDIAREGVSQIERRRNAEEKSQERQRDEEAQRQQREQESLYKEQEREKERNARADTSSDRRIGDITGGAAEAGLRSQGLGVAAGRDELVRANRDQVASLRELAEATDDVKEKTRLLNEAQAEESAGTQRVGAYDQQTARAHRERMRDMNDATEQITLRNSNQTDQADMIGATKKDNEGIADAQERIANAKERVAAINKDFDAAGHYIGSGTSAQGAAEAKERAGLNQQIGQDQDTVGALSQNRDASAAQVRKRQQEHMADMATETAANEARAHGSNQEAQFIELQAQVRKEIADAPASERDATRKLATSQLDKFIHGQNDSKPFMGSMGQYQDELQMQVLKNDPNAIAQAQAMKNQINDPAGTLGNIAKGVGNWLMGGDDKHGGDPHEKTKSAGEKLEKAAEKLLGAAIKFGGITLMEAF